MLHCVDQMTSISHLQRCTDNGGALFRTVHRLVSARDGEAQKKANLRQQNTKQKMRQKTASQPAKFKTFFSGATMCAHHRRSDKLNAYIAIIAAVFIKVFSCSAAAISAFFFCCSSLLFPLITRPSVGRIFGKQRA